MRIILHAFSFLRDTLRLQGIEPIEAPMEITPPCDVHTLIATLGLKPEEVEAVFINRVVMPKETLLKDNDRVALLPPGTPGSYRLMLGIKDASGA